MIWMDAKMTLTGPRMTGGVKGRGALTRKAALLLGAAMITVPLSSGAQPIPGYNLYGSPGLVDMPTADAAPDATLGATVSKFGDNTRTTLSFQITPRLSGSFRYSAIDNFDTVASVNDVYYDRSFDLRYQLLTEGAYRPAVTIGLQDFIGTGLYGAEYIVASKDIVPGLRVTGGLGWGRLASRNAFATMGTRPTQFLGQGGVPTYDQWFRGDVAGFGGISYAPNDRLTFKLEYSSDNYDEERVTGQFDGTSAWNYGIDYRFRNGAQLSLYHAYGNEVGAQLTLFANPKIAPVPGGVETAPLPVAVRNPADINDLGWTANTATTTEARTSLTQTMATDGLVMEGLKLEPRRATLRLRNPRYGAASQAIGRTARAMTRTLPDSIEEFVIVPVQDGMPMSAVILKRSDLESLENDAAVDMLARSQIVDGFGRAPAVEPGLYPRFTWSLAPFVAVSAFDPDNPVRLDGGLRLRGNYLVTPNFVLAGAVTKKIAGNLDAVTRTITSNLPRVRTDYAEYSKQGDPAIEYLTSTFYGRPGENLYSRLTLGYLEKMYAGASGELLWKPVNSRLALGVELNLVQQRAFDQMLDLRDYRVAMGHASAYYDFGNGFHGQLDMGRYLAGDYGATLSLDREFANGWRVGAYATFTDASFEDFGEGSFDKGLRFTIPLSWALGTPTRQSNNLNIKSLTRDGGAQLEVRDRLYDQVRTNHTPELAKTWGRFWR
nr:YjbH domain-containing protein [Puniceibacterium confluentis]